MKKIIKIIAGVLILLLIGIQFMPVEKTNPPVTREVQWDSPQTRALAERACFDCHSNHTKWPWYANVAPVSWRMADHVEHAREHLNFSEWDRPNEDFDEIKEVLEEGEMPLWDYLLLHSEAELTAAETTQLLEGLQKTYEADPAIERPRGGPPPSE
jgi:hypothetical protein